MRDTARVTVKAQTPMLQQYFSIREQHPGVLLAMRVGDFYEFYGEDAETAAAAAELTLTGREDGSNGRISMAGVPFHAVEKFLARLVGKGYRVALCDQLEDPKKAKGLVRRGITRVLTPGTLMEDSMLSATQNNFLAAVGVHERRLGLATLDPSTGEFQATEFNGEAAAERLAQELARLRPAELLVPEGWEPLPGFEGARTEVPSPRLERAEEALRLHFQVSSLRGFGCEDRPAAILGAASILAYAQRNHLPLEHARSMGTYSVEQFMALDPSTRRSLELSANLSDGSRRYTLLDVLDLTVTPMGARRLRRWIEQPLLTPGPIRERQEAVARLTEHAMIRGDLREALKGLSDLERLVSRAAANLAGPRDLAALRESLRAQPAIEEPLRKLGEGRLRTLLDAMGDHTQLGETLARALVDEPPHTAREGGVIRAGHDEELDRLRDLQKNGKAYLAGLERDERERTGIGTLKVGFNSVFGYFLEVSKREIARVPEDYIRKQTTANAERYITAALKEHESMILGAEEKAQAIEAALFQRLREEVASHASPLLETARAVAEVDTLASLAEVAVRRRYVRPEILEEADMLEVEGGRHPVVEASTVHFVPNDTALGDPTRVMVITGPNMSGKSTYLRQNALIALLAQIGSFVPADRCRLGLCDRIFARIGAKDELALGQSTFMVEMLESAHILNHATERSLVVLDEVGRGTSTYDGLAIAWAMTEHLAEIGAKTLFATHYHQLNALADQISSVGNFRVSVEEIGEQIVWTHRVLPGGTDRSYGIHVARMAGVPAPVLDRAGEILAELEGKEASPQAVAPPKQQVQMSLFEAEEPAVVKELKGLDVNRLTPMEALSLLDSWKRKHAKEIG